MVRISMPLTALAEIQVSYPLSSDITLKDSMLENQSLFYQTYYQETLSTKLYSSEGNETGNPRYYITNTTQNIIYDSINNKLIVNETYNALHFEYNITSTSNEPLDNYFGYPFEGGWQHNYPKEDSKIILNAQEISYLTLDIGADTIVNIVLTYRYKETQDLKYGETIIPVQVFESFWAFELNLGSG